MKPNPLPLIAALFLFSLNAFSQKDSSYTLLLKSGPVTPQKNISAAFLDQFNRNMQWVDGQSFAVIQFDDLPAETERQKLLQAGIELLDYIPNNAYTVSIKKIIGCNCFTAIKSKSCY